MRAPHLRRRDLLASASATAEIKLRLAELEEQLLKATDANETVLTQYKDAGGCLRVLEMPLDEIKAKVPHASAIPIDPAH